MINVERGTNASGTGGQLAASQVSNVPAGNIAATTVQAAINELDAEKVTVGSITATQVANTPAGTVAAATVQAAINELDTEKVAKAGDTMTGQLNGTSAAFTGTINANYSGWNIRVKGDGTSANDYAVIVDVSNRLYVSNWDFTRGLRINADGSILTLGTGATTFGGDTYRSGAETKRCGARWKAAAAESNAVPINFGHRRASVPTISITNGGTRVNMDAGSFAASIDTYGFLMNWISVASGDAYDYEATYTTSA